MAQVKLFIGGISWDTTEETLMRAFSPFGKVDSVRVVTDKNTGRSRGFGFVTFLDRESAQSAIDKMNNTELDGRTIRCDFAQDRDSGGGGGGGGREGGRDHPYERRGGRGGDRGDRGDRGGRRGGYGGRDYGRGPWRGEGRDGGDGPRRGGGGGGGREGHDRYDRYD